MEDKDYIKDLFRNELEHLETDVRVDLWSSISNNIPSSTTKILTKALIKKIGIGLSAAAAVGSIAYVLIKKEKLSESFDKSPATEEKAIQKDQSVSLSENTLELPSQGVNQGSKIIDIKLKTNNVDIDSIPAIKSFDNNIIISNVTEAVIPSLESEIVQQRYEEKQPVINQSDRSLLTQEDTRIVNVSHDENISEEKEPSYTIGELPNIFTPNNDRTNDFLTVNSEGINEFYLIVLNASNQVVYSSSDSNFSWDGTGLNGEKVPVGDYVYFITGKDKTGASIYKSSLLRITY